MFAYPCKSKFKCNIQLKRNDVLKNLIKIAGHCKDCLGTFEGSIPFSSEIGVGEKLSVRLTNRQRKHTFEHCRRLTQDNKDKAISLLANDTAYEITAQTNWNHMMTPPWECWIRSSVKNRKNLFVLRWEKWCMMCSIPRYSKNFAPIRYTFPIGLRFKLPGLANIRTKIELF